jgi:hypothetical protein
MRHLAVLAAFVFSCATTRPRESPPAADGEGMEPGPPGPAASAREDHSGSIGEAGDVEPARARSASAPRQGVPPEPEPDRTFETPATLREAVSGVAAARGRGTPRALHAIAGVLERIAGGAPRAAAQLQRMRAEIATLERLGAVDLDRADRLKDALDHGMEATRELARAEGQAWLEPWVDAAAAAANGIDPAMPLGLQSAVVQDALRSLADAVLVAEQFAR